MREILFRGKRVDNGEWVEGLLWKKKYNTSKLFMSYFPDKDDNEEVVVIDPETVGQYTGLTDKNGKKIFEGDIVRFDYVNDEGNDSHEDFLIIFVKGFRAQYLGNIKCAPNTLYDEIGNEEGYVVGNKWDNPELLEDAQ